MDITTKNWISLIFKITLILLIACAIDYASVRYNRKINITGSLRYELTKRTKKILDSLRDNLYIIYFGPRDKPKTRLIRDMLQLYSQYSHKVKWKVIDPERNPSIAKKYHISYEGSGAVIEYRGRIEKVFSITEADITNAILRLITNKINVYFLLRDGEYNPFDPQGICKKVLEILKDENYNVGLINWKRKIYIPKNARLIIDWRPKREFSEEELKEIEKFVKDGGRFLFLVEPFTVLSLNRLLNKFHVEIRDDIVVDISSRLSGGDMFMPVLMPHDIMADVLNSAVMFPLARPIYVLSKDKNIRIFLKTSPKSWSITKERYKKWDFDYIEGKSIKGPFPVAVSIRDEKGEIAVVGDADFATDAYLNFPGMDNEGFFINLVEWLCRGRQFLAQRPRLKRYDYPFLKKRQIERLFIFVMSLPAIALLSGVVVYINTKKKSI